jgi:hypothetical protein
MRLRLTVSLLLPLLCQSALSQVRGIDPSWVVVTQPEHWISPPRELHLESKTGPGEIMVLFPSGDYGYVACYLIRQKDGRLSISRGDGFLVKTGTWERNGKDLVITSRTVYMTVVAEGRPIPSQPNVELFNSTSGQGLRREKDRVDFRRDPSFNDLGFLASLISCDRLYYDGHKALDGPHPCMPPATRP